MIIATTTVAHAALIEGTMEQTTKVALSILVLGATARVAYLTWRMQEGETLGEALESGLEDLDGFYTFVVGTKDGFGVVRDPIACKPAVLAETEQYVAFGSEYRALVNLPGIEAARVWEPEPATVYFWRH